MIILMIIPVYKFPVMTPINDNVLNNEQINNTHNETNKQNLYFLCSIEKALTIDDVKFILTDSDICTEELTFIMPESSFKSKKFLIFERSKGLNFLNLK